MRAIRHTEYSAATIASSCAAGRIAIVTLVARVAFDIRSRPSAHHNVTLMAARIAPWYHVGHFMPRPEALS